MLLPSLRGGGRCGRRGRHAGSLLVRDLARVTAEQPGRRELAELVTDHVLGHVHGNELVAVVHRERVPDEVRDHRARARPRLHDTLLVARVHRADLLHEAVVDVGSFMYASRHYRVAYYCVALPRLRPRTIKRWDAFLVCRVFTPSFLPHGLTTFRPPRVRPPCG